MILSSSSTLVPYTDEYFPLLNVPSPFIEEYFDLDIVKSPILLNFFSLDFTDFLSKVVIKV